MCGAVCSSPATVVDKIFEVAELHGLVGEPGSDKEATVLQIAMSAKLLHPRRIQLRFPTTGLIATLFA